MWIDLTIVASNIFLSGAVVVLRRKDVGNPKGFFAKSFAEYKEGFEENGKPLNYNLCMHHIQNNPIGYLLF